MCSWPTRSQRVEAIGGGTGRPEEPSEELRPTDLRSLHSRHPERGSYVADWPAQSGEEQEQIQFPWHV